MALETTRSLGQLKSECSKLGLKVTIGAKEKKEDYIRALREYFIEKNFGGNLPESLALMLTMDCPMLCRRYQELKESEQKELWEGKYWYAEQKIDGARQLIFFVDGEFDFYSRNLSVKDYLPVSYKDTIWTDYVDKSKITHRFILDAEIVCTNPNVNTILAGKGVITETGLQATTAMLAMDPEKSKALQQTDAPLKFMVFDCLWFDGKWLLDKPLYERRKYLKVALQELLDSGFKCEVPASSYKNRKAFYRYILKTGGEGVVFKNMLSSYKPTTSRSRDGWIKLKRTASEAMGDTIDGFITGFVEADPTKGWADIIGGVEVSVHLRKEDGSFEEHMIARVSNIPLEDKKKMTEYVDGKPVLKPEFYGKVVEVDGQCVTSRVKRLKHAVLVRWRPDRSEDSCILDESFLNSLIL